MNSQDYQKLKNELKSVKDELKVLRQTHEFTVMQLSETKESEQKLRKLNETLMISLEHNTINLDPFKDIKVVVEGDFTNKRIAELERELDQYRNGVNVSIDRRVRQIVKGYTELQEQDKMKSRLKYSDRSNVNIHYNVTRPQQQNVGECHNCQQLEVYIADRDKLIEQLQNQLEQLRADRQILTSKMGKTEALVQNIKRQNLILQTECSRLEYQIDQDRQQKNEWVDMTYDDRRDQRKSYTRSKYMPNDCKDKQNKMIRQISSIVNGMSSRKQQEVSGKSRVLPMRDSSTLFSIKNGINRPNQLYY